MESVKNCACVYFCGFVCDILMAGNAVGIRFFPAESGMGMRTDIRIWKKER